MCRVDFYDYLAIVVRKLLISATLDKLAEKNIFDFLQIASVCDQCLYSRLYMTF